MRAKGNVGFASTAQNIHALSCDQPAECAKISENITSRLCRRLWIAQSIRHNTARFSRIDRAFLLRRAYIPYFFITRLTRFFPTLSRAASLRWPIVSSCSCHCSIASSDLFILYCLFAFEIECSSCHTQCSRYLAFGIGAVRPTQLVRQFYLLCRL